VLARRIDKGTHGEAVCHWTKNGGGDRKPCASPIETRAQTLVILQAQSQEEEGGAQQFEREL
jgi:hypothetical protein